MILIYSGLPASGKTTAAINWVAEDPGHRKRINYDDIRMALYGCKGSSYFRGKDIKHREGMVKTEALNQALGFLNQDPLQNSIVVDNTNLTEGARKLWVDLGKNLGIETVQEDIDTSVATCVERDRLRKGDDRVGRAVIERMALTTGWIDWNELYIRRKVKDFVVVDIDGTLSDPSHRLHHIQNPMICVCGKEKCPHVEDPFKPRWDLFHAEVDKDLPNRTIIDLVSALHSEAYYIIVVSGRSPEHGCGIKTEDWLNEHGVPYMHLFMRAAGDYRPDYVHKQQILDLLPRERIAFVLDDRDQVVEMWRKNGLTCLQVAKGAF